MNLIELELDSFWERLLSSQVQRMITLYDCYGYSGRIENICEEISKQVSIFPEEPCPYPRGSLGKVLWCRERYREGLPIFSTEDTIETLERDISASEEHTLMYSLKLGRAVREDN
jgi:hypothetical protein